MTSKGWSGRKRLVRNKRRKTPGKDTEDRFADAALVRHLAEIERVDAQIGCRLAKMESMVEELVQARDAAFHFYTEENREFSEEIRVSAELRRETAEQDRTSAEQQRETMEQERSRYERLRKEDELNRARAELGRLEAEKLRLAAEEARKAAEELRLITEKARLTAEMMRAAYRDQLAISNEVRKTTLEFDQAAQEYRILAEELKKK